MKSLTLLLPFVSFISSVSSKTLPKVAIIGGGVGGTSCAYFLNQLFQKQISISLFEKDEVGGRLQLMDIGDYKYEAGGSVIHPRNQYMVEFSKVLGLGIRQPQPSKLGIYNGDKFVFEESDWYILTVADLFWRYGLSMFHVFKDVKSMLDDFSRIYNLQEKGYAFTSVEGLLNSMSPGFLNMTRMTLSAILQEKGYSELFMEELVQSIMMVNYGQTNNISAFAGFVSLAGAENTLWSIDGGNKLIPDGLLKTSKANYIQADVIEVELLPDKKFSVKYHEPDQNENPKSEIFDSVVLSSPLIKDQPNIKFVNFKENFQEFERSYHQTVSTFIRGSLNPSAFDDKSSLPDEILTNNNNLLFNSIGKSSPVDNVKHKDTKDVYKVFSQEPLSKEAVGKLFTNVDVVKEKIWLAYPHYNPPEEFVPFVLYPGLYYPNAIELSASAMEMSVISAKNAALLIYNDWKNALDKIDPRKTFLKDEL